MKFAGLDLCRPSIMGIVNVTPDSFADAGETFDHVRAIERGLKHIDEGADIIDVGGESTRPGATPVSATMQCRRILPVVEALAGKKIRVSVDTRHSIVMAEAIDAGAKIINDVSALTHDPKSLAVIASSSADVILMHMRGTPDSMARRTRYGDVVSDVRDYLQKRLDACLGAGVQLERLCIDPGIGFAKTPHQNIELLGRLREITSLERPILVGVSRKFGLNKPFEERIEYSVSHAIQAIENGASIVRVHDVKPTRRALDIWLRDRNELKQKFS